MKCAMYTALGNGADRLDRCTIRRIHRVGCAASCGHVEPGRIEVHSDDGICPGYAAKGRDELADNALAEYCHRLVDLKLRPAHTMKGHVAEPGKSRLLVGKIVLDALDISQVAQLRVRLGQPMRAVGAPGHHTIIDDKPFNSLTGGLNMADRRVAHISSAILIDTWAEPATLATGADLRSMNANEHLSRAWLGNVKILNLDLVSADLDQSPSHFRHLLVLLLLGWPPSCICIGWPYWPVYCLSDGFASYSTKRLNS